MNWLLSIGSLLLEAIVSGVVNYFRQKQRDETIAHDGAATAELANRDEIAARRGMADKIHDSPKPHDTRQTIDRL